MKGLIRIDRHILGKIFSSTAFFIYSWSLVVFFWDLPSLRSKFPLGDILGYLAYQFTFALFESIAMTVLVALVVNLFSWKWFRGNANKKTSVGIFLLIYFTINSILFKEYISITSWLSRSFALTLVAAGDMVIYSLLFSIIGMPVLFWRLVQNERVCDRINVFAESTSILAFPYIGLSIFGFVIVMFRNFQ